MTKKDLSAIAAVGAIATAAVVALNSAGVNAPAWIVAAATGLAAAAIVVVRVYVKRVGPDNTSADETLEAAEDEVLEIGDLVKPANAKQSKPPTTDELPPAA